VIDGIPFVVHDTAGLREATGDRVEQMGIGRTSDAIGQADVVLFVLDGSVPGPLDTATRSALAGLDAARSVVLINKVDLPVTLNGGVDGLEVSAATGAGLDALRAAMLEKTASAELNRVAREGAVLNARLAGLLAEARTQLATLARMIEGEEPLELVAQCARQVLSYYEEATGRRYQDGLLDVIFSRFCIGK
jgi:tRNA modification GTPase